MARRGTVTAAEHGRALARVADLEAELGALRAREQDTATSLAKLNTAGSPLDRSLRGLLLELLRTLHRPGVYGRHGFLWVRDDQLTPHGDILDMTDTSVPQEVKDRIGAWAMEPWPLTPELTVGLAALERRTVTVADLAGPDGAAFAATQARLARQRELGGALQRSHIAAPVLVDGEAVAVVMVSRLVVEPFTPDEIAFMERITEQMALAIGNARLTERLEGRTRDLAEALERQRAAGEVLEIVSRSPAELQAVLDAICERGMRLLGAQSAAIQHLTNGSVEYVAGYRDGEPTGARLDQPVAGGARVRPALVAATERRIVHLCGGPDAIALEFPETAAMWRERGINALLAAPLGTRDGVFGALVVTRATPEPFSAAEQELIQTFAGQAVVALENSRLFEALEERNREMAEALEREQAAADVLRVISRSPADLDEVLSAILQRSLKLCDSARGAVHLMQDGLLVSGVVNTSGNPPRDPHPLGPELGAPAEAILGRHTVHFAGTVEEFEQRYPGNAFHRDRGRTAITVLAVPLLRDGAAIGAVSINRDWGEPYTPAQIALVGTFADQAVIAIENARLFEELQQRNRDLTNALERQTATADVLEVISRSPADLQVVLDAIVERAMRLCNSDDAFVSRVEGDILRIIAATVGLENVRAERSPIGAGSITGAAIMGRTTVHFYGDQAELERRFPGTYARHPESEIRSAIVVPLLRESAVIGTLVVRRRLQQPFTAEQIALLEMFAGQAVIAIENARLFTELQTSNSQLTAALDQQTAITDVLRAISRTAFDVEPVLQTLIESAARLCDADIGRITLYEAGQIRDAASVGKNEEDRDLNSRLPDRQSVIPAIYRPGTIAYKVRQERRAINVGDILSEPEYAARPAAFQEQDDHYRSRVIIPLLRDSDVIGMIHLWRRGVRPFSDAEQALAETFADQAMIAIENARLFAELEQRNREQAEALEREQATSNLLRMISQSPENLEASLQAVADAAVNLCKGDRARVILRDGDDLVFGPSSSVGADLSPYVAGERQHLLSGERGRPNVDAVLLGRTVHAVDLLTYVQEHGGTPEQVESMRAVYAESGARRLLVVPLMRGGVAAGTLGIARAGNDSAPFNPREIALAETFADQAVIAIENARFLPELQEQLERQTATAEILETISQSPADVQPVLEAIATRAARLCDTADVAVFLVDGDTAVRATKTAASADRLEVGARLRLDHANPLSVALREQRSIHIVDAQQPDPAYPTLAQFAAERGYHSILNVPLIHDGTAIGGIFAGRQEVKPYTEGEIALLETFADQAVIGIAKVRLFSELQERTRDLEQLNGDQAEALEREQATAEVLRIISRSPTALDPALQAIADACGRLCDADAARVHMLEGDKLRFANASFRSDRVRIPPGPRKALSSDDPTYPSARAVRDQQTVHIEDLSKVNQTARDTNQRTVLAVPLLREGGALGAINLMRGEVRSFSAREIALAETFADQAVIAIENARLFEELRQRNHEQAEALEREQATAEVLRVISSSPEGLDDSLQAVADTAQRLCRADFARVWLRDGDYLEAGPSAGAALEHLAVQGRRIGPMAEHPAEWTREPVLTGRTVHIADLLRWAREHEATDPNLYWNVAQVSRTRLRTILSVPLRRGPDVVGVMVLNRTDTARPYSDREIALAETFADQAVIAVENSRLFEELQTRSAELEQSNATLRESLEQQRTTADVLRIIAASANDLGAASKALVVQASRLLRTEWVQIFRVAGDNAETLANSHDELPIRPWGPVRSGTMLVQTVTERQPVRFSGTIEQFREAFPSAPTTLNLPADAIRAVISMPLLHSGNVIGALLAMRLDDPFSERDEALLQTFADQATIAIENARLFDEVETRSRQLEESNRSLAEALEQQTGIADVLSVINAVPADLERVLPLLLVRAVELVGADEGAISRDVAVDDSHWRGYRTHYVRGGPPPEAAAFETRSVNVRNPIQQARAEQRTVHVWGPWEQVRERYPDAQSGDLTHLVVPFVRSGTVIGTLRFVRSGGVPFTGRQIALAETFAEQAVIAIENARLFEEVQARSLQLEQSNETLREALEQQTATSKVLEIIAGSPTEVEPVFQAIVERAAPLVGAPFSHIMLVERRQIRTVACQPNGSIPLTPLPFSAAESAGAEVVLSGRTRHVWGEPDEIQEEYPVVAALWRRPGSTTRAAVSVPLVRGGQAIGVLSVRRPEATPFTPRQIALLETFADQAVIAIENARLFNELQAANREQAEALEQQMATSDVLRIIGSAPADLQGVLEAVIERAARLVGAQHGNIIRLEGDRARGIYQFNPVEAVQHLAGPRDHPISELGVATFVQRALDTGAPVEFIGTGEEFEQAVPGVRVPDEFKHKILARLSVPLTGKGEPAGVMQLMRYGAEPYSDKHRAVLATFADQAVIAIENARLFEEIQQRTRELEAASRAKSEFLSRMSHELRTPLNAIIGFAEIMEMDPATSARQHERIRHIHQGGRHLLGLINEVLDITRIEAGRLSLSIEAVRLDTVVQEVLDLERPLAAEAGVALALEDPAAFRVAVQADRQRLRQIILNLVANAIKYNREDGTVTLRVTREQRSTIDGGAADQAGSPPIGESRPNTEDVTTADAPNPDPPLPITTVVRLTVTDTGSGIPEEQLGRLFAPFERLSADSSGVEGTGLGLAIARGLAEAMGGAAGVTSVVGEGSAFWVELPEAVAMPALPFAEDLVHARSDAGEERLTATILYIEDNQPNVELVSHALAFRSGITLLTAADGASGLRMAMRYHPHLILLDLNLPDLSGDEVLARLRGDARTAATPVVMISADATAGQVERLLAAGARAYLTKPLDVRRFLALVDEVIAERG